MSLSQQPSVWAVVVLLIGFSIVPLRSQTNQQPDLTRLTPNERQSIESACSYDKFVVGPAAYNRCLSKQLSELSGSQSPDLTGLSPQERQSIESACSYDKFVVGAAAYNRCLTKQLSELSESQSPDLTGLSPQERQSIESACSYDKFVVGAAAYIRCLTKQLSELSGTQSPDLTQLGSQERQETVIEQQGAEPNAPSKRLAYFTGTWTLVGDVNSSPFGPGGKLSGTQRNALRSDGSVLSYWDEQRPPGTDSGQAVYRYDSGRKTYSYHSVSNNGETEDSTGTVDGDTWIWTSSPKTENGTPMSGRFTTREVSPNSYTFQFEIAPQNGTWTTVLKGKAAKSK